MEKITISGIVAADLSLNGSLQSLRLSMTMSSDSEGGAVGRANIRKGPVKIH